MLGTFQRAALALGAAVLSFGAAAQTIGSAQTGAAGQTGLNLPSNPQFVGPASTDVRKATAIVNGEVITETDIDHRLALVVAANNAQIPAEELQRIRAQILRNLVDETLQIQAAAQREIQVEEREIEQYFGRYAERFGRPGPAFAEYLRSIGSSERSIKRQIRGELAWQRLQRRQIEPFVSVGDEEVQAIIDRLNASRGTREYRVSEIFLAATPETAAQTLANAQRIVQQIRAGASIVAYARQFSEASTAAAGGDLGWVRAEQLPPELGQALPRLQIGVVSDPITVSGGFSIVEVQDTRQILVADPRDSLLSLMQLSIGFPAGSTRQQAETRIAQLAQTAQTMGGCGRAQEAATSIGAELVSNDQIRVRDLPPQLQEMLLNLNVGQTTAPFGSVQSRVSVLVLCGRDDPQQATGPSFDQVYQQLNEERVNRRAQRFLRDLRRDAVIEWR